MGENYKIKKIIQMPGAEMGTVLFSGHKNLKNQHAYVRINEYKV